MTPGYNLRIGKATDRLLFREMLSRLSTTLHFDEYRYVGLGGPFLEDFRLLHESFPEMRMTSIERTKQVWHRQKFHKPCRQIELLNRDVDYYFANVHKETEPAIVWLDYTDLHHRRLRELWGIIPRLAPGSLLRITLRAKGTDEIDHDVRKKWAKDLFGQFEPPNTVEELDTGPFAYVLLRAIKRVIDDVSVQIVDAKFHLLQAFVYDDGTPMLTFCGLIASQAMGQGVRAALRNWQFRNFKWSEPYQLRLPALSLKERLFLEPLLPSNRGSGRELHKKLGYSIEESKQRSIQALDQYRQLAGAYPRFIRAAF
jgi:hypothetical protein